MPRRRHQLELESPNWTTRAQPKNWHRRCYRTKSDALRVFTSWNQDVIDSMGGLHAIDRAGGFDAVNERYGLKGPKKAQTVAQALWAAFYPGPAPYCLDRVDLDTLNETNAVRDAGGFRLPDHVLESKLRSKEKRYYSRIYNEEGLGGIRRQVKKGRRS